MAAPVLYTWPLQDLVALVNNIELGTGIRTFTFNGTLAPTGGTVTLPGISRKLSLYSASDLSGINFTITGVSGAGGSQPIVETIAGPTAAATIYTVNTFNYISSITVNIDMTGHVNIGTGLVGYTNWQLFDWTVPNALLSVQAIVTGTINYTFESTSDNALGLTNANINKFNTIADMIAATTTLYRTLVDSPIFFCRIKINSSDATGQLITNIMQQGI